MLEYPFEDLEVLGHLLTGVYRVGDVAGSVLVQIIESDDGYDQVELSTSEREAFTADHVVEVEAVLRARFCSSAGKADERHAEDRRG